MVTTVRFRWVAGIAICLAALGVLTRQEAMALSGLMLLSWVGVEWFVFRGRMILAQSSLIHVSREIIDLSTTHQTLNIEQTYQVEITATVPIVLSGYRYWLNDIVPAHCVGDARTTRFVSDTVGNQQIKWRYTIQPTIVGRLFLPGIQCVISDRRGLFRWQSFLPIGRDMKVLPFVTRPQSTVSVLKKNNIQILNGNHRHRRPGFSAELLGIREYQPGDPPRSIAWKPTARLGKLMTCEYENEVPIRASVFCDLSDYQFVGRPGRAAADRVVSVAASISRLLLADRDPVSCDLIAETRVACIPHGHGERQLTRMLQTMLAYCDRQQVNADADTSTLVRLAWVSCYQRFPDLFDDRVNRVKPRLFPLAQDQHLLRTQGEQLSFALAALYGLSPGQAERIQFDDQEFRRIVRQYMSDFPIRHTIARRVFDAKRQSDSENRSFSTLCRTMMERVTRAKDNELFVVLGVAPVDSQELERLENTIRIARAAHHRVMFIVVEPPHVDDSYADFRASRILAATRETNERDRKARMELRLTRLGARVASVDDPRLVETVANEIDLLRSGRVRGSTMTMSSGR